MQTVEEFMDSVRYLFDREAWEVRCAHIIEETTGFENIKVIGRIPEHYLTVFQAVAPIPLDLRHKAALTSRIIRQLTAKGLKVERDMVCVRPTVPHKAELTVGILTPPEFYPIGPDAPD